MTYPQALAPGLLLTALLLAPQASAQDREAVRTKYQEPVYPESLEKAERQGNVLLVGRIVPILGDIAIFPADASGKRTAPEGFPIRRGQDPALRAEALLDVPPAAQARTLTVRVEAESPKGKRVPVFQPPVAVPANATEVRIPVVANIGADWEEGVWMLRFTVNGAGAGAGQFWLASDPAHFQFVIPKS